MGNGVHAEVDSGQLTQIGLRATVHTFLSRVVTTDELVSRRERRTNSHQTEGQGSEGELQQQRHWAQLTSNGFKRFALGASSLGRVEMLWKL